MKTVADFFAGSGLVSAGLSEYFKTIWANDIDRSKATVYNNNIKDNKIFLEDIVNINADSVPMADLYWASFPCQDLSLAGNYDGLSGKKSSLVKEFFRIVNQKPTYDRPELIVLENVYGLITSNHGHDYIYIHTLLSELGYRSGAVVIDASYWVPQSRVRVFIIAVKKQIDISNYVLNKPNWSHPTALLNIAKKLDDFVFWNLPEPKTDRKLLRKIIERDAEIDYQKSEHFLNLIPENHRQILDKTFQKDENLVFAGYKRTRLGKQTLELRFDEIGGCLRTASGGSSKQLLVFKERNKIVVRYMTSREAARLMGAPDKFWLPDNKNEAYTAMGDAVALPVTRFLAKEILSKLIQQESFCHAYA